MPGIQKAFLKRVASRWSRELHLFKPVHLIEVPQLNKGSNFICDHYFPQRGRAYFIQFSFSPKRIGEFTIDITVSDSLTRSILDHAWGTPSPTDIGMFAIGKFIGVQTRRWALIDHGAQADEFDRSLGLEPMGFANMRSRNTWFPPSFAVPQQQIFDSVLDDVNSVLTEHVLPKLQIEHKS